MKLTIVIPALNEEQAIGSIIERTLEARTHITQNSPVTDVEIIVVSDGSTDRTAEIASGFADIKVIIFEKNRGYGAAIKRGFEEGSGDLVGFLDADGTCNPEFFATLCNALIHKDAAIALGSRMGPQSCMPKIRRIGNRIYAFILSVLSNRVVTDSASGMRVIRSDVLPRLYPLPDGLHFTPAMSARALMDEHLRITEEPMPYQERLGESKLHVVHDGIRFLRTILEMTMMWRPAKLFVFGAGACFALTALLAMHPIEMWLRAGRLQEDMIYRLLFCSLLGTATMVLLSTGVLCENLRRLVDDRVALNDETTFVWTLLDRVYSLRGILAVSLIGIPCMTWLVGRGAWTWVTAGYIAEHWSRVVLAGLLLFMLGQMIVTTCVLNLVRFHTARKPVVSRHTSLIRTAQRSFVETLQDSPAPETTTTPLIPS